MAPATDKPAVATSARPPSSPMCALRALLSLLTLASGTGFAVAFSVSPPTAIRAASTGRHHQQQHHHQQQQQHPVLPRRTAALVHPSSSRRTTSSSSFALNLAKPPSSSSSSHSLTKIPDDDDTPIPFVEHGGSNFIECYADSIATLDDGVTYTIGEPCDYAVALGYFDDGGGLIPVELDDDMMDDVFPVAESIIEEEFGEELSLVRTPQTLTLVGELEEEEDGDDDEDADDDDDDDEMGDDEEEVEILVTFEHKGLEFNLVRLLDPVLLVGKADPGNPERRILLTPEESDKVMPSLEEMFLEYQEERDSMAF